MSKYTRGLGDGAAAAAAAMGWLGWIGIEEGVLAGDFVGCGGRRRRRRRWGN
jgi:hypothetical protein